MLLAVDIGNTMTHLGLFDGPKLVRHQCIKTKPAGEVPRNWTFGEAVVCSVVPSVRINLNVPVLNVTHKLDLGLKIKYRKPGDVGADRIANAVAVKELYGYPAFVVDSGTAITIDVISKTGDYLGGVIFPGFDIIRRGLKNSTALLPLVDVGRPRRVLGQTTKDAIRSGMYYGLNGMIGYMIERLKKELQFPRKTVIINTGGWATERLEGKVDKFLTLKGLRIIYERNRKRSAGTGNG